MPDIHTARRERLRAVVASFGADAALITSLANVRYLTGLASSNAAFLIPADGPGVLATDARYALAAERDCPGLELAGHRPAPTAAGRPAPPPPPAGRGGCGAASPPTGGSAAWPSKRTR